jgi:hypothetical protein
MKQCSYCGGKYSDALAVCPNDQQPLVICNPNTAKNIKVGNYTAEQLKNFQNEFALQIKQNKKIHSQFAYPLLGIVLVGFVSIAIAHLDFNPPVAWLVNLGILLGCMAGIGCIAAIFFIPKFRCPACGSSFCNGVLEHCPECGSNGIAVQGWLKKQYCKRCQKHLNVGKQRNFSYRFCSRCGIFLSDKGL